MENKIIKNEEEINREPYLSESPKRESIFKKIFKGLGIGGLVLGGGIIQVTILLLRIIIIWGGAVGLVWIGISALTQGLIIQGLLILFLGVPLSVIILSFIFTYWLFYSVFLGIVAGIIFGTMKLFNSDISFWTAWGWAINIFWIFLFLFSGFLIGKGFIKTLKNKDIKGFLKEYSFWILVFAFTIWLLFL
ncbi:hypothetical protein KKC63_03160 [Patescibacteria group bacterium]|nr:hypothetical protein [Patescibacteria group bacterium]MBU4023463.1 hypothetical protein [Patescibacteria group bacterium]MBU4078180.1 hypothetical protein [Patescibacteria group bacterium]